MKTGLWQPEAIQAVTNLLEPNSAIRALLLTGSSNLSNIDDWSDVDFVCVVADPEFDHFFPAMDWLNGLGLIFGFEQFGGGLKSVTRVCFDDFRRMDFGFIREGDLQKSGAWDYQVDEVAILFSRSVAVAMLAQRIPARQVPPPDLDQAALLVMQQHFWFRSALAVTKVMRDDMLIGLHLALDLARDCLVLAMMYRDVEVGSNKHRYGGLYNEVATQLGHIPTTPQHLLDFIGQTATVFESLIARKVPGDRGNAAHLRAWLDYAKTHLPDTQ